MRIGIDARMLGPGFGLARYVQQLVIHLEQQATTHEYVLFMRQDNWDEFIPTSSQYTKVLADIPWYSLEEQVAFSSIIKQHHLDLMHFPHWNVPYMYTDPYIVTIHDLTMFHFPRPEATTKGKVEFFLKDQAHRALLKRIVKKAQHIITASEWTKQDMHRALAAPLERMTTIYQAPFTVSDPQIFSPRTHQITQPYVLYVGAAYPHKNLDCLVAAWAQYVEKHGQTHQLVLAGKRNYFYDRLLALCEERYGDIGIRAIGFVPDNQLASLYKQAALFVYPSLYEGFGLPPLEAMQQGTPVIAAQSSCLPEVLGEGVYYVDPSSSTHMADAISRVLQDEELQFQLKQQGRAEVTKYSWESLARQTVQLYTRYSAPLKK